MAVNKKQKRISRLILSYLQKNPDASDTLEGITRWWLELERIEISVEEASNILESLIKKGIISVHKTTGGETIYKIKKEA